MEVVVLVSDQRRRLRDRIRAIAVHHHRALIAALVIITAAAGTVVSTGQVSETVRAEHPGDPAGAQAGAAGVAEAYGHPLRCLSITIAPDDHSYARADFNRAVPCGRYAGYATAVFHRVRGVWLPVLDSLHYSCPAARVPLALQAELGVCP